MKIYIDGGTYKSRICLAVEVNGKTEYKVKERRGELSNNQLEYLALIYCIEYANNNYTRQVLDIYSDSKLIVNQLNGSFQTKDEGLFMLKTKAEKLRERSLGMHGYINLKWIPREQNLAGKYLDFLKRSEKSIAKVKSPNHLKYA